MQLQLFGNCIDAELLKLPNQTIAIAGFNYEHCIRRRHLPQLCKDFDIFFLSIIPVGFKHTDYCIKIALTVGPKDTRDCSHISFIESYLLLMSTSSRSSLSRPSQKVFRYVKAYNL